MAIGLVVESRLAQELTGFPAADTSRVERLLGALDLPLRLPPDLPLERLVAAARRDKKNRDGEVRCALPTRLGRMPEGDGVTVAVDEPRLEHSSGTAKVFDVDTVADPDTVRRSIGVVFQSPSLDQKLTAMENLRHQGVVYRKRSRHNRVTQRKVHPCYLRTTS